MGSASPDAKVEQLALASIAPGNAKPANVPRRRDLLRLEAKTSQKPVKLFLPQEDK